MDETPLERRMSKFRKREKNLEKEKIKLAAIVGQAMAHRLIRLYEDREESERDYKTSPEFWLESNIKDPTPAFYDGRPFYWLLGSDPEFSRFKRFASAYKVEYEVRQSANSKLKKAGWKVGIGYGFERTVDLMGE